jgi:GT2 family glycosyltransferase
MISVIYCTKEPYPQHTEHIKKTSGLRDIEIIEYVNRGESLTTFYNKGLKESTNNIVVFCHDDIVFNTKNWGKKLIKSFTQGHGILGVAGTTHMSDTGRWWDDNTKMLGQVRHTNEGKYWDSKYSNNFGDKIMDSILVDGLFFAVNKEVIKEEFSDDVEGFHFYEIDFCIKNHLKDVKVGVMSNISITHKSVGQTNKEWEENRKLFVEKFKDNLPMNIVGDIWFNTKEVKLKETPKVSVIIPTKGSVNLLKDCVNSLYEKDSYRNMEVIIADTGSEPNEIEEMNEFVLGLQWDSCDVRIVSYDYYNFAKINNDVVRNHVSEDTELLLFCNNDIKLINNAITQMVNVYLKNKKSVGTIGARLYFGDDTIQHSGVTMFLNQQKNIMVTHHGFKSYYNYHNTTKEVLGNTAALMMTPKWLFDKIGGYNPFYQECFEDVEYNIECLQRNRKNYFVGEAVAYHLESQTRNKSEEKQKREYRDISTKLIPTIMTSRRSWNYFSNIKAKDFEAILKQQV